MNFEYYYGTQADQFSFIRIPRILLLDEAFYALSLSAKVLYSVLLDRMGLSMKNKWLPTLEKCEHKNSFINILLYKFRLSFPLLFPLCYIVPPVFTNSDKGKYKGKKF